MATKVLDVALDRISKKYPSFKPETGRRVVGTLSDAYKSYQKRKGGMSDEKSAGVPAGAPLSSVEPENHSLVEIPKQNNQTSTDPSVKVESGDKERRDSFYDNFEEYVDNNPSSQPQKFPNEAPKPHHIQIEGDTTNQRLSDNPPASPDDGDSEKKQLVPPLDPQSNGLAGPPKPPEGQPPAVRNDISQYLQKKSLAQGMMDLALLSANTNQLRYILDSQGDNMYYSVSLTLIVTSLVLQIVVGLMLVWNSSYNVQRRSGFASADKINNLSVFGVFLITLINVFVSTFGNVPSSSSGSSSATTIAPKPEGSMPETSSVASSIISPSGGPPIDLMPAPPSSADAPIIIE